MNIHQFFSIHSNVVVAVSGGVDSALLLYFAKKYANDVTACFVKSAFQPEFELNDAREICDAVGVQLNVINIDVLSESSIISNPDNRCYFCKKVIFNSILDFARALNKEVVEGTNASDDVDDRPGYKALGELGVLSPLRLCGIDKRKIRELATEVNLSVADKASYACLATRIPTNTIITEKALSVTEKAEHELFKLGLKNFRIRYINGSGMLKMSQQDMDIFNNNEEVILGAIKPYYSEIVLDKEVRTDE